jgi:hypothetical protein
MQALQCASRSPVCAAVGPSRQAAPLPLRCRRAMPTCQAEIRGSGRVEPTESMDRSLEPVASASSVGWQCAAMRLPGAAVGAVVLLLTRVGLMAVRPQDTLTEAEIGKLAELRRQQQQTKDASKLNVLQVGARGAERLGGRPGAGRMRCHALPCGLILPGWCRGGGLVRLRRGACSQRAGAAQATPLPLLPGPLRRARSRRRSSSPGPSHRR